MEIPEDIRAKVAKSMEYGDRDRAFLAVCQLVAAERERCARIAERFAVANLVDEEATERSSVAQSIANTIREASDVKVKPS